MTDDERVAICEAIAVSCMWGHSGIAHVILEELDKRGPGNWVKTYKGLRKETEREHVGVVSDRKEMERLVRDGYRIVRFSDGIGFMDKICWGIVQIFEQRSCCGMGGR